MSLTMRNRRAIPVAMSVVGAFLAIASAAGALAGLATDQTPPPPPPAPAPVPGPAESSAGPRPVLTPPEKQRALATLAGDPRAKGLLRGASYAVADIGPWTLNGQKVGAAIIVSFPQRTSFAMSNWPVKITDNSALGYHEHYLPASASNVGRIYVLVDQRRHRVVTFVPDVGANVMPKLGSEKQFPRPSD